MIKNTIKKIKEYIFEEKILTVPVIFLIVLGIISFITWRLSVKYVQIADLCAETISFVLRFILTQTTYFIPFSLAEFMLYISIPTVLFLLFKYIFKIIHAPRDGKTKSVVFLKGIFRIIAFCGFAMFIFTFTFGVCYGKTPVNENKNMDFERRLLSADDLYNALEILIDEVDEVSENIKYVYSNTGSTKMPYGLNEMNEKLNEAYKNMLSRHNLFRHIKSKVKPVILSVQMSKMHITGIYAFFTGEANLNIDFPDYNLPFTAAHEMAHLMGTAKEDEANFIAFLVCLYSNDDYIKYSGLVNMTEYIKNALYRADKDKYYEIMGTVPSLVTEEIAAFSKFFEKYRDTKISKVASVVNDTYLQAQGQQHGVNSYGFVVDLTTVYLLEVYDKK